MKIPYFLATGIFAFQDPLSGPKGGVVKVLAHRTSYNAKYRSEMSGCRLVKLK